MSEGLKGDYQVCEEIGRGRFGAVFRCFSPESGEFYACKSIDKRVLADSVDRECIEKEAKIMQLLSGNPNVVQVVDAYEDETYLDIVMELCDSSDLYDRVTKRTFSEVEAAAVISPLMEAIAHCHGRGVAHRDIKPDNILFDSRSRLKLADFGSADLFHDGRSMRGIVGTPYYVAPEVLSGRDYNEKVDVWSAGVIMYIMLAGIPPFYGDSAAEIFEAVLRGNLRFPTRIFYSVSPAAKDLLRKMLCKDASKRFSAEQVLSHPWITSGGEARSMTDLT
ncbi:phosphoenolpyruvate carboxylase kinase 1-like [Telopea speciosissima]|uniref:phosphoenolpyruvate carboxylase kinase 1-like n=1 Tax=Telopea speciosissima TaxID=54955 RepID=UPI001CC74DEF|nr:phosphoenolpyruvate carboxylase kinase 1-like [Telopea speciosissima]